MRKSSESRLKAVAKYDKANTKSIMLKFNLKTDADILAHFETLENRQGYIKELIRRDMNGVTAVAEPQNKILEGSFTVGEYVTVLINGEKHKRKVKANKLTGEPVITILGLDHYESEFN